MDFPENNVDILNSKHSVEFTEEMNSIILDDCDFDDGEGKISPSIKSVSVEFLTDPDVGVDPVNAETNKSETNLKISPPEQSTLIQNETNTIPTFNSSEQVDVDQARIVKTSKGNDQLIFRGYVYHRDKQRLSTIYWRCRYPGCMGRAKSMGDTVVATRSHTHSPDTISPPRSYRYIRNNTGRKLRIRKWKPSLGINVESKINAATSQKLDYNRQLPAMPRQLKMVTDNNTYNGRTNMQSIYPPQINNFNPDIDFANTQNVGEHQTLRKVKLENEEFTTVSTTASKLLPKSNWPNPETVFPRVAPLSHFGCFKPPPTSSASQQRSNMGTAAIVHPTTSTSHLQDRLPSAPTSAPSHSLPGGTAPGHHYPVISGISTVASSGCCPSILDVIGALSVVRRFCEDRALSMDSLQQLEKSIARHELEGLMRR